MAEFFRVQKTSNYTVVDNQCIRDKRLSYKARMLLILMLSVRDDFQITKRWLVQNSEKDGRDSVESGLIELQKCGYLKVTRQRNSKGQLSDALYTIYELPVEEGNGESTPEQPEPENPSQAPEPEKPAQEKPAQENPHYRNTNIRNTIPPISPTGEGASAKPTKRRKPKTTARETWDYLQQWSSDKPERVFVALSNFIYECRDENPRYGPDPLTPRGAAILVRKIDRISRGSFDCMVALLEEATEKHWKSVVDPADRFGTKGNVSNKTPSDWGDGVVSL